MKEEEWNRERELPESWRPDFEKIEYIIQSVEKEFRELCRELEVQSLPMTSSHVSCIWTKDIEKATSTFLAEFENYGSKLFKYEDERGNVTTEMLEKFAHDKGFEWDPTYVTPELINSLVICLQKEPDLLAYAVPSLLGNLRIFMNEYYPQFRINWLKSQPSHPGIMSLNTYEYLIVRDSQVPPNLEVIQDLYIMMVESGLRLRDLSGKTIPVDEDIQVVLVPLGRRIEDAVIWLTGTLRGMLGKYSHGIPRIPKWKFDLELRKLFRQLNLRRRVFYLEPRGGFNHKPLSEIYTSQSGMDTFIRDEFESGAKPHEIFVFLGIINRKVMQKYIDHLYDGDTKKDLRELVGSIYKSK